MPGRCSDVVEGVLGHYCPILTGQDDIPPFCDASEDNLGTACLSWEIAQRAAGKVLPKPNAKSIQKVRCTPLHAIDYMLAQNQILCVEDNPVSMKVITKALAPLKRDILKAKHGQEALDLLSQNPGVKLILLDLDMPVMNGYDFVDAVCELHDNQLPFAIILVSELKVWEKAKQLISKGVISYIKKPYTSEKLMGVIADGLNQFRMG